jgi:hypothetical protein
MLRIVETNTFKHITHIELVLVKASDASIKKYLADLVTKGIDEFTLLSETSEGRINGLEKCKGDNTDEIFTLVADMDNFKRQIQDLTMQNASELTRVKEDGKVRLDESIRQKDSDIRHSDIKHQEEVRPVYIISDPQPLSTVDRSSNRSLAPISPFPIPARHAPSKHQANRGVESGHRDCPLRQRKTPASYPPG